MLAWSEKSASESQPDRHPIHKDRSNPVFALTRSDAGTAPVMLSDNRAKTLVFARHVCTCSVETEVQEPVSLSHSYSEPIRNGRLGW
jgi:hypothetical protein